MGFVLFRRGGERGGGCESLGCVDLFPVCGRWLCRLLGGPRWLICMKLPRSLSCGKLVVVSVVPLVIVVALVVVVVLVLVVLVVLLWLVRGCESPQSWLVLCCWLRLLLPNCRPSLSSPAREGVPEGLLGASGLFRGGAALSLGFAKFPPIRECIDMLPSWLRPCVGFAAGLWVVAAWRFM